MSRMGREFSLVLLGSGILTAGYFLAPTNDDALAKKQDEQSGQRVYRSGTYHGHSHGFIPIFVHSPGYAGASNGRPGSFTPGVTRGGVGSIGRSVGTAGA